MKSNCCNAPMRVSTADEGTSCYVCAKCNRACDERAIMNKQDEEVVKRFKEQIAPSITEYGGIGSDEELEDEIIGHILKERQRAWEEVSKKTLVDCIQKLNALYNKFENDKPPLTFNKHENDYNIGLYDGTLKACETISRELFSIDGDELKTLPQEEHEKR